MRFERIGFQRFQSFGTLEMALNSGFALAVPKVPKKRVFFLILRARMRVIKMETLELWNQLHANADRQWVWIGSKEPLIFGTLWNFSASLEPKEKARRSGLVAH